MVEVLKALMTCIGAKFTWVAQEGHEGAPATSPLAIMRTMKSMVNGFVAIFDQLDGHWFTLF